MSWKQGLDCYTDNIKVKISEKYKPPPRITLPMSDVQRLILNKQAQENTNYDFELENKALDLVKRFKSAKRQMQQMLQEREARLEKVKETVKEQMKAEKLKQMEEKTDNNNTTAEMLASSSNGTMVLPINDHSNILTPTPLSVTQTQQPKETTSKNINISDFENDTYSPFDNMELKSINDMEELAQVLNYEEERNHRTQSSSTGYNINNSQLNYTGYIANHYTPTMPSSYNMDFSQFNNYYAPTPTTTTMLQGTSCQSFYQKPYHTYDTGTSALVETKKNCKSVPDIMNSINTELENIDLSSPTPKPDSPSRPKSTDIIYSNIKKKDSNDDLLESLSYREQEMCKLISQMGFPYSRVARVCKMLGEDQKKVVEHLLVLSDLIDLGFEEKDALRALIENNNDRDKALDKLVS